MSLIYIECYNELCIKRDLDIETVLKYLNLLLNKNKNYCIDFLYTNFIYPVLSCVTFYEHGGEMVNLDVIKMLDLPITNKLSYEEMDFNGRLSDGYCCSDCDGCLGEYKRNRYRDYLGRDFQRNAYKEAKNKLTQYKSLFVRNNPIYNTLFNN